MSGDDYIDVNRRNWESRVPLHEQGSGLDAVHLQCHIGTDTLSLARLGARMHQQSYQQPK